MKALAKASCEADVLEILRSPEVSQFLKFTAGGELHVTRLSQKVFQIGEPSGDLIIRFPGNEEERSGLLREEKAVKGIKGRVSLQIPDTRVFEMDDLPTFAIHPIIPGKPLTSEMYEHLSVEARNRLVTNLAQFFSDMHAIPLTIASEWLGYPEDYVKQTKRFGKPGWFGDETSLAIRASLAPVLKSQEMKWLEEVIVLFNALPVEPDYMVFGHGDLHGYNMAIGEDALGPKMIGVFDLGCMGILDIHEDFFRLSLVSEDLLERVIEKYQVLTNQKRSLRRDRIAIYYRAFLFYLMREMLEENHAHLKSMLKSHVEYYQHTYGSILPERKV